MATKPLKKGATYDDLCRVPDLLIAEILDGDLYASPHPALPHARATSVLIARLGAAFDVGDEPGGWIMLFAPELHFGNDVLVPDLASWRRERLPSLPNDAYLTLAPDWICEVVSPATEAIDRGQKLRIYTRERVATAWFVDPLRQSLEVLALETGGVAQLEAHHGSVCVHARPFAAIELELSALWN
jgi:Uma2 family endonuclease